MANFSHVLLMLMVVLICALTAVLVGGMKMSEVPWPETLVDTSIYALLAEVYAIAYLGIGIFASSVTRSTTEAMIVGLVALLAFYTLGNAIDSGALGGGNFRDSIAMLLPSEHRLGLWTYDSETRIGACIALVAIGLGFMMIGAAVFQRRNV
ncbi:MAG: ABC transporter permease subunit [Polyangiales bacterium]